MNENDRMFADLWNSNSLVIGGSIFQHKKIHKATWISPDSKTQNQIHHITINRTWRRSLLDVRVMRGADAGSDHYLVRATFKIKLLASKEYQDNGNRISYRTERLKHSQVRRNFCLELRNRFQPLME
jgi:hypothetical protein